MKPRGFKYEVFKVARKVLFMQPEKHYAWTSCMVPFCDYALTYVPGTIVTPVVGKIMVFDTIESALKFRQHHFEGYGPHTCIMRCYAPRITKAEWVRFDLDAGRFPAFWRMYKTISTEDKAYRLGAGPPPRGTLFVNRLYVQEKLKWIQS